MNWRPKAAVSHGALTPLERNPRPIAAGTSIGHVHLKAIDLDRIARFYVDILGFDVVARMPQALFLSAGGYHHHLAFNTWHTKDGMTPPENASGLYHIAINFPTETDLADSLRRLVEANWPLDGASDHGTHLALYLRDPEGNGLEFAWDRPMSEWPLDENGNIAFVMGRVDLLALLEKAPGNPV